MKRLTSKLNHPPKGKPLSAGKHDSMRGGGSTSNVGQSLKLKRSQAKGARHKAKS